MTSTYYNSIAQGYNELHGEEQRKKYIIIANELKLPKNANVLDVGAGTGLGYDIIPSVGIDPAAELIKQHPNKQSLVGDAEQLPYSDHSFDAVISVTAIHHADYKKGIAEMKRVSKGPLAISVLRKSNTADDIVSYCLKTLSPVKVIKEEKDWIIIHNPHEKHKSSELEDHTTTDAHQ